jgi:hypothetical protein
MAGRGGGNGHRPPLCSVCKIKQRARPTALHTRAIAAVQRTHPSPFTSNSVSSSGLFRTTSWLVTTWGVDENMSTAPVFSSHTTDDCVRYTKSATSSPGNQNNGKRMQPSASRGQRTVTATQCQHCHRNTNALTCVVGASLAV